MICSPDIDQFYSTCSRVVSLNYKLLEKITTMPQGIKALSQGRVVIINNSVRIRGRTYLYLIYFNFSTINITISVLQKFCSGYFKSNLDKTQPSFTIYCLHEII